MKKILLAVGVWVALSGMAWAGFDEGLAAYEKKDYATALNEWQPLAKQGNAGAQYNLGVMYDNGDGVPKDAVEAVRWFRLAADQGVAQAQYNLGVMYDNGAGVPKNDVVAYALLNLSSVDFALARQRRDALEKIMSVTQIEAGQALSMKLQSSDHFLQTLDEAAR